MSSRAVAVQVLQYALLRLARVLQSVEAYGSDRAFAESSFGAADSKIEEARELVRATVPNNPRATPRCSQRFAHACGIRPSTIRLASIRLR